jgi:hypothetical protein
MRLAAPLDAPTLINPIVDSLNGGQLAGFRNAIINGNFDIAQRGTSFSTSGYGFDRWYCSSLSNTIIGRTAFSVGYGTTYAGTILPTNTTNTGALQQAIESTTVNTLRGKTITLSFYAVSAGGTLTLTCYKNATADTLLGGSWSSIGSVTSATLTASPAKTTLTVAVPSDASAAGLMFSIGWSNLPIVTAYIWNVQLEVGSVATPFEQRPIGTELALCQRYLPAYSAGFVGTGVVRTATIASIFIPFPVTARTAPTGLTTNTSNALAYASINAGNDWTNMAVTFSSGSVMGANTLWTNPFATMTVGQGAMGQLNTPGYILFTGCEL